MFELAKKEKQPREPKGERIHLVFEENSGECQMHWLSVSIYICSLLSFSVLWPLLCCTCSPFQCNKYHSFCRRRSVQMVQEPKGIFENAFFASCVQVCALRTSSLCHYHIYIEQLSTHLNYGQDVHDGHCMRYLLITSASQNWIYYCYLIYISMRLKWRPKT